MITDPRRYRNLLILGIVAFLLPYVHAQQPRPTAFYVVAHPDDWQLFMNPSAWDDARSPTPNTRVVFIYLTAGDAGLGTTSEGRPEPYYIAREEGALRATRFIVDAADFGEEDQWEEVWINGKELPRYVYKNTASYFFRLPDGNFNGQGFPLTGNQSLQKLHQGTLSTLSSIDDTLSFQGWEDLTQTLVELARFEVEDSRTVSINIVDPRPAFNWIDHSDHRHTGIAVLDAIKPFPCIKKKLFVSYITALLPRNLNSKFLIVEAAVWGVTTSGLSDFGHRNTFDALHEHWLGRNYFSVIPGFGSCPIDLLSESP